jgi:hypothetical protein
MVTAAAAAAAAAAVNDAASRCGTSEPLCTAAVLMLRAQAHASLEQAVASSVIRTAGTSSADCSSVHHYAHALCSLSSSQS